jgi:isoquinoline 1-oxidoreductase subunit beta
MINKILFRKNRSTEDKSQVFVPSRRDFLKISSLASGGFILGINFQCSSPEGETFTFAPNVYLSINSKNEVILIAHRSEMGTGIRTSLPMIVADELGADWSRVKIVQAEGDEKYGDQNTDGSYSVRMFYEPMRKAGATARTLLIRAAAEQWGVANEDCYTENGYVHQRGSRKKLSFGQLVEKVKDMNMPADEDVVLKEFSSYKLIGKAVPIYDNKDIATGKAVFGADVDLPGMKVAAIYRSPVVGATLKSYDDSKALAIPGVRAIVKINGSGNPPGLDKPLEGLAVIADHTWAAIKGRESLEMEWDMGENQQYDSAVQLEEMLRSTSKDGKVRRERGDFKAAARSAASVVERTYKAPFYAHATIEPPAAIADYKEDGTVEIWAPTQHPQWAKQAVAAALETDVANVKIHITLLGGGFGRKSKPDFVVEAALLSKAIQAPVRVQWTREDDLLHDFYHSHSAQRIKAAVDGEGKLTGWNHHTVFPAIGATANSAELHPSDGELGLGCIDFPFDVEHIRIETHESKAHTRIGWLRSVSNIHHAFATCCMMDELAEKSGKDPIDYALELLGEGRLLDFKGEMKGDFQNYGEPLDAFPWDTGRLRNVIEIISKTADWSKRIAEGQALGFAVHKSFLTYVACVVQVERDNTGRVRIPHVHYVVDCGIAVNTDRILSQFEGGAQFATSLATTSAITLKNGRVEQQNFDGYQLIRMPQSPQNIHVHIVPSTEKPTGVGEPPVPPYIPALCNAMYKLNGQRIYELPFNI